MSISYVADMVTQNTIYQLISKWKPNNSEGSDSWQLPYKIYLVWKCNLQSSISSRAPGFHFKCPLPTQMLGWHCQMHLSTWNFPPCTMKMLIPGTNICYKTPQNLHKRLFTTASGTWHHCSWAQHRKPSTIQGYWGCNPPSAYSCPHSWDGPELT